MAAWRQLPLEIRQRILEFVAEIRFPPRLRRYSENPQKVASYACVSREWQQFFEQYTFRTLALTDSDIAAFCLAVEGDMVIRLSYMVQMRLSIRLERYRCAVCTKDEDDNEMERFVFARPGLGVPPPGLAPFAFAVSYNTHTG